MQNFADLPDRLGALRKRLGFPTDPEIADAIGISVRTFYTALHDRKATTKTIGLIELAEERAGIAKSTELISHADSTSSIPAEPRAKVLSAHAHTKPSTCVKSTPDHLQRLENLVRERSPKDGGEKKERLAKLIRELNEVVDRLNKLMEEQ